MGVPRGAGIIAFREEGGPEGSESEVPEALEVGVNSLFEGLRPKVDVFIIQMHLHTSSRFWIDEII